MMLEPITILIADDHTLFRDGLKALFGSVADTVVIGEATTGAEAIQQAELHQPDVILMDIQMPDLNGIEATRQIVRTSPHIGVIIITMFEDNESLFAAMRAGARGYVLSPLRGCPPLTRPLLTKPISTAGVARPGCRPNHRASIRSRGHRNRRWG